MVQGAKKLKKNRRLLLARIGTTFVGKVKCWSSALGAYFLLTAVAAYSNYTARSARVLGLADGARPFSAPLTCPLRVALESSVGWMGIPVRRR